MPLCDAFSVTTPKARSQCLRIVVNVFKVLRALHNRYPEHRLALGDVIVHGDSEVTIMGDYVEKVAHVCSGEDLVDLYKTLRDRPLEGLARPTAEPAKFARGSLTVQLQPVGFFRNPVEHVKRAARSVLTALEGLHRIGWVHRDVRPPNVMVVPGEGWYLMDLEWAAKVNSPIGKYSPTRDNTPPEIRGCGEKVIWTPASDMWQFGQVLGYWRVNGSRLDAAGLDLCAQLTAESPQDRLSATLALQHKWLS